MGVRFNWCVVFCAASAFGALGCSGEGGFDEGGLEVDGPIAEESQELNTNWHDLTYPPLWADLTVGVGRAWNTSNQGTTHTWYNDGSVCTSSDMLAVCGASGHNYADYTAPDSFDDIVGVTMVRSLGTWIVHAYYNDNTFSKGTVHDLDAVAGKLTFDPGPFDMDHMIDVAYTGVVDKFYYYWRNQNVVGGVKRTIGTRSNCCTYSGIEGTAVLHNEAEWGPIVGIDFDQSFGEPTVWRLESYYTEGKFNWTRDTRDLTQPTW